MTTTENVPVDTTNNEGDTTTTTTVTKVSTTRRNIIINLYVYYDLGGIGFRHGYHRNINTAYNCDSGRF